MEYHGKLPQKIAEYVARKVRGSLYIWMLTERVPETLQGTSHESKKLPRKSRWISHGSCRESCMKAFTEDIMEAFIYLPCEAAGYVNSQGPFDIAPSVRSIDVPKVEDCSPRVVQLLLDACANPTAI